MTIVPAETVEVLLASPSDGARDAVILIALLQTIVVVSVMEAVSVYGSVFVALATAEVLSTTVENGLEEASFVVVMETSRETAVDVTV
jgi:hypothetical protein